MGSRQRSCLIRVEVETWGFPRLQGGPPWTSACREVAAKQLGEKQSVQKSVAWGLWRGGAEVVAGRLWVCHRNSAGAPWEGLRYGMPKAKLDVKKSNICLEGQ